jgi:hypothetical protein
MSNTIDYKLSRYEAETIAQYYGLVELELVKSSSGDYYRAFDDSGFEHKLDRSDLQTMKNTESELAAMSQENTYSGDTWEDY